MLIVLMVSDASQKPLMFHRHLIVILLACILLLRLCNLRGGRISAKVDHLKPPIVTQSYHKTSHIPYFSYIDKDGGALSLGCPHKLHIFIDHQVVRE